MTDEQGEANVTAWLNRIDWKVLHMSEDERTCKACGRALPPAASSGHRTREYCDDVCRQAARRSRQEVARRCQCVEQVEGWGTFLPATVAYLANLLLSGNEEGEKAARRLAGIVQAEQGELAQLQERFRQYVAVTNERLETLTGELAAARQQRERSPRPKPLMKGERQELEQARADLLRLYQERARQSEEIHRLVELTRDLQMHLGAARNRIADLESKRDSQAEPLCLDEQQKERAAGQEEQRNIEDYREKLLQAAQQTQKLEKQVEIQRQMLATYHARFYPSSPAVATQRLMALGAAINYRILLKYDAQAVEVAPGEGAWKEFVSHASYEDVCQAILQAQHLFDNLFALGMIGKRDGQAEPN
jgi:hypothetical protein